MKNFKCKNNADSFYIENLILDACDRNAKRFTYHTPEYTVTFESLSNGEHKAIVTDEDMKVVASSIVEATDI